MTSAYLFNLLQEIEARGSVRKRKISDKEYMVCEKTLPVLYKRLEEIDNEIFSSTGSAKIDLTRTKVAVMRQIDDMHIKMGKA